MLDVSEQKEAEAALKQSERRLVEADRLAALGSLAGGVAHQINNALTYVRFNLGRLITLELSRKPVTPVRLHRLELLQDIREGTGRIERVISELKHFSKVDEGPGGPIDVPALLGSVARMAAHEIRHRAELVFDSKEVPAARAHEGGLRQVFLNLLINAAQAIPEGEAHMNEIRLATRTDAGGRVVVEVTDSGRGIPARPARPHLRAVLHDPAGGDGHRARPLDLPRHRHRAGRGDHR